MKLEEHRNWITEEEHKELRHKVIYHPSWRFGQVSDSKIVPNYPMWFKNFLDGRTFEFKPGMEDIIKVLAFRFMDQIPDKEQYTLIRCMAASNTFGLDGDVHVDWPHPNVSLTGVLYSDKIWDRNWGGDTVLYIDPPRAVEYEPRKLLVFDSSIEHIGKGPQRRCPEMRSVIAFQAVKTEALEELRNASKNKD